MSIKTKLLSALESIPLDDFGTERLVDLLVDKLKEKEKEIERLQGANAHERLMLQGEREQLRKDFERNRTDPRRYLRGAYLFIGRNGKKYRAENTGDRLQLYEGEGSSEYVMQEVSWGEWGRAKS